MNTDTKIINSPQTTKEIPSAVQMAQEVIKNNPHLFLDNIETKIAIGEAMINFYKKCDEFLNPPISLFEQMGNIAKIDAENRYGIKL